MIRNKIKCGKCHLEISKSNYNRHYEKCNGVVRKCIVKINDDWKNNENEYKCPYCNKIYTKKGICSHIILNHTTDGNIRRKKNNFINYNQKIKEGKIKRNKNQFELAKERGEIFEVSEETREKIRLKKIGIPVHNLKTRGKLSEIRSKIIEELGNGGFKDIKWYKIKNINGEEFIVRGKWELLVANKLNESKILWIRKIYLKYTDDYGVVRTYCPDFYIPELKRYIEVKGYFSEKDKKKLKAVIKENNIELLLIMKKEIKDETTIIEKIIALTSPLHYM
jgi:hypothetical protein